MNDKSFLVLVVPITLAATYFAYHFLISLWLSYFNRGLLYENFLTFMLLPEKAAEAELQLFGMGFDSIGILETYFRRQSKPSYEHWYYHLDGITGACIVPQNLSEDTQFLLHFVTIFEDDSIITVRYPTGENIETRDYISRYTRESIERAFYYHLQKVNEWSLQGRTARPFRTAADVKKFDNLFISQYKRRDFRRVYVNLFLQGILLAVIAFAGMMMSVAILSSEDENISRWLIVAGVCFIIIVILSIIGIYPPGSIETTISRKKDK